MNQLLISWSRKLARLRFVCLALGLSLLTVQLPAQSLVKVDFANDVQPVLRENCFDCHGPSKQKAGMRLDRKSSALKAFSRRVVPGSSANSMVYHRLIGNAYGTQMPPKAALHPEQIAIVFHHLYLTYREMDALVNTFANAQIGRAHV